jgi:restriction system protein
MTHRRKKDDGIIGDLFDLIIRVATMLPWWMDLFLAIFSYFSLHYLSAQYPINNLHGQNIVTPIFAYAGQYLFPIIFVFGGVASFRNSFHGKELLWSPGSGRVTEMLAKMSWQDFELLIGQWFKTQGYEVMQAGGAHADGGIDIELRKDGELYLVQCKHYRAWRVPVQTIRDLYGVMTSRGAAGGFVVTSGQFTIPAKEFAEGRVITLIDGEKLSEIIPPSIKSEDQLVSGLETISSIPLCPKCDSSMVRRTAHNGSNIGRDFWGCSKYPSCKGIVPIN